MSALNQEAPAFMREWITTLEGEAYESVEANAGVFLAKTFEKQAP